MAGAVAIVKGGRYRTAMLSYQHAYHAGNLADLHKHRVLAGLLERLTRKPRPITYLESHAGRGLYDLASAEAQKTGEAAAGIGQVALPAGPYARAVAATRAAHGDDAYPGSPAIARALLREGDRIVLVERHPAEHAALAATMGGGAEIHRRDGHEALPALAPPKPRRGLALIDPSYEEKDEYDRVGATARTLLQRWPEGVVLVWYPVLAAGRHTRLVNGLRRLGARIDEVGFGESGLRMLGSGLALLNAPYGAEGLFAPEARLTLPDGPRL